MKTVNLKPGTKVGAITVAPGSSRAYVSSDGDPAHPGELFVIDGNAGTLFQKFSMKNTGTPSGVTSLVVSGDGSTLYGIGWDRNHLEEALVTFDASTGVGKTTKPFPKGSRLVISGSNLIADTGTILDTAVPGGLIFGNDSRGLAAFPDGRRVCVNGGILTIGTGEIKRGPAAKRLRRTG